MNFHPTLPWLLLCGALSAQMVALKPEGGGELKIGATPFRFELTSLTSAPPKGGLPGAVKLEGDLLPQDATRPFHLILTLLKDGSLYLLQIDRKTADAYPDSWAATPKTHARPVQWEDHPGGRVEIRCKGSLTGVIGKRPQEAVWSGRLWAVFPSGELAKE